jgi:hypothetical protein
MSSKNREQLKQDEDNRALWERPALRRLVTKYAEGGGNTQDEGNPTLGDKHSAKNIF